MAWYNIILIIIWAISAILSIILVLMHSGKGTGLSDMIASSMYNTAASGIVEKNLDRMTLASCIVFGVTLMILMLTFPQGAIG